MWGCYEEYTLCLKITESKAVICHCSFLGQWKLKVWLLTTGHGLRQTKVQNHSVWFHEWRQSQPPPQQQTKLGTTEVPYVLVPTINLQDRPYHYLILQVIKLTMRAFITRPSSHSNKSRSGKMEEETQHFEHFLPWWARASCPNTLIVKMDEEAET